MHGYQGNITKYAKSNGSLLWTIWSHRNDVVFKNQIADGIQVFALIQIKFWTWITNKYPKATFSYFDWCLCPTICIKSLTF